MTSHRRQYDVICPLGTLRSLLYDFGKLTTFALQAYKIGLYGPKIVWMFPGWYSGEFWRRNLDNVPCTLEEMEEAADGAFIFAYYFKNPNKDERGLTGLTGV